MSAPLVSVIVPTYNRAHLIATALDSVFAQDYPAYCLEVIVVDDGSTDNTEAVVTERYGDRVTYLTQRNQGVSSARNLGMAESAGDFFAFLDTDDRWMPSKTKSSVDLLLMAPHLSMVLTDVIREHIDPNTGVPRRADRLRRRETIPHDGMGLAEILMQPTFVPSSALFRREVYESIGGFDSTLRTAEDIDFLLRAARIFGIAVLEEPVTIATRGLEDGLSSNADSYDTYRMVLRRFLQYYGDELPAGVASSAIARAETRFAQGLASQGRTFDAGIAFSKSVAYSRTPKDARKVVQAATNIGKSAIKHNLRKVLRKIGLDGSGS